MAVTITSTSDSEGTIREALGLKAEGDSAQAADTPNDQPTDGAADDAGAEDDGAESDAEDDLADDVDGDDEGHDESPADASGAEAAAPDDGPPKPRKRTKQSRLNRFARDKYVAEGENRVLKAQLAEAQRLLADRAAAPAPAAAVKTDEPPAASEVQPLTRPKREDFLSDDEYEEAYDAYVDARTERRATAITDAKLASQAQARQAEEQRSAADQAQRTQMATLEARIAEARQRHPDYDAKVKVLPQDAIKLTPAVLGRILESPVGADLAYHLVAHPTEAERIERLDTGAALVELGKLEGRIEAAAVKPAAPSSQPRSQAQEPAKPPISPLGDTASASARVPLTQARDYQSYKAQRLAAKKSAA